MCESEDLSQRTHNNDLAVTTLFLRVDFDPINERTDDLDSLRACCFLTQNLLQFGHLPTVEVWKIGDESVAS